VHEEVFHGGEAIDYVVAEVGCPGSVDDEAIEKC
jgi:hypothetical protein